MVINLVHLLQNPENNLKTFMEVVSPFYLHFIKLINSRFINGHKLTRFLCIRVQMKDFVLVQGLFCFLKI